jgi:hypothetical protein
MENIIRDVLIDYMEENGFFTKHQHGFRKGRPCATQLIEVMDGILSGSFVKTLWKNAFRSSALHLFSVCISPLSSMMH